MESQGWLVKLNGEALDAGLPTSEEGHCNSATPAQAAKPLSAANAPYSVFDHLQFLLEGHNYKCT